MRFSAFLCLLLVLVTGCSKAPAGPAAPSSAPAHQTYQVVRLWVSSNNPYWDVIINEFHRQHADIRVEKVNVNALPHVDGVRRSDPSLLPAVRDGKVDVFYTTPLDMRTLVGEQLILPLDTLIRSTDFDLAPYGPLIEGHRWNGQLYDLPVQVTPQVLYYNETLFKSWNLPLPGPGWTWEQFQTAATALSSEGTWGFVEDSGALPVITGANMAAQLSGRGPISEQGARPVLRLWAELAQHRKAAGTKVGNMSHIGAALSSFAEGKGGMVLAPVASYPTVASRATFAWNVAALPSVSGNDASIPALPPVSYGIAANTKNPEAAWKFLRFLAGEPGASLLVTSGAFAAYRTPSVMQEWMNRTPRPPSGSAVLFSHGFAPQSGRNSDDRAYKVQSLFSRLLYQVSEEERNWEEAAAEFERERTKLMAQ